VWSPRNTSLSAERTINIAINLFDQRSDSLCHAPSPLAR
jgi:hypothetical protein